MSNPTREGYRGDVLDLQDNAEARKAPANQKLVGKVLTSKNLNATTVKKFIDKMWGNPQGLVISNTGTESYIFNFSNQEDAKRIYNDGPWRVLGHMLSLQWWRPEVSKYEVNYDLLHIWIQIYDLSLDKINRENAEKIGATVGRVIEVEDSFVEENLLRTFFRIKVELNTLIPLKTGFWFQRREENYSWAKIKYEKLCDYCYNCGRIGHDRRVCKMEMAMAVENPELPRYGPNLSIAGLRPIAASAARFDIQLQKQINSDGENQIWEACEESLWNGESKQTKPRDEIGSNQQHGMFAEASMISDNQERVEDTDKRQRLRHMEEEIAVGENKGLDEKYVTGEGDMTY
ncbi:uncharacterized protein LOC107619984 [Arachis ipaensis]|uniref:CCHC-type domain-containing protein n=1 Tax=Arachis hypogaea TaxID=3818 RepID=A0A444WYD7_ARAHY|nr:uncharacterized protein LOC107619984 [Arachis ipaensis]RYQ82410.1 hypothetical protein Ahy_B10g101002 [Arachis hypogaea]